LGRISKGEKCSVVGCSNPAVRSLSTEKVGTSGLKIGEVRRAYLCESHYKEFKKKVRKIETLERWRRMGGRAP